MPQRHPARFPGTSNDPKKHTLSKREAVRLADITDVAATELAGKPMAELSDRLRHVIDPKLFAFRRICGQVVKLDDDGNELPVPFATVTVYDVDLRLVAWSPPHLPWTWFFPFSWQREKLATVTTDECGRFCVWVPRFDIDFYLRWRLERRCYLEWLRKPTLEDLLEYRELIPRPEPQPDPPPIARPVRRIARARPIRLDARVVSRAARLLDTTRLERLREVADDDRVGAMLPEHDAKLSSPALLAQVKPPLTKDAEMMLAPDMRKRLAARVGVQPRMLAKFDPTRVYGPVLRCKLVAVPEWSAVIDVPDLTFEVTQDIDGDGNQEVIYQEGLFDVRWDTNITDVKLYANQSAIAAPSCDVPDPGPCGDPAILFAGSYPLQVPGNASDYHDAGSGYALLPNRPDADGVPGGARTSPAVTPFTGRFFLVGCAESPSATHYRVHHTVGGSSGFLTGAYGPLTKVVGGVLQQLLVSPVQSHWYPIIPRADGWTPVGILAPVNVSGTAVHGFRLELGKQTGANITPVPNGLTDLVNMSIDTSVPVMADVSLHWRQPDVSHNWTELDPYDCAVMARTSPGRVQIRLGVTVTANHMRHFAITGHGCGPMAAPQLITDGRDGLPIPPADAAAHWHTSGSDNSATRMLYYELPAGAPAGCYRFAVHVTSRAFRPTDAVTGTDPVIAWQNHDPAPLWIKPVVSVALQ
jgi:hypothetical protein